MWIRSDGAFDPIVSPELFYRAQDIIRARSRRFSDNELLEQLRSLLQRAGRLSGFLIDEADGMASSSVYRHRFGSLVRAYQLISYDPERDYSFVETNRQLRLMHPEVVSDVVEKIRKLGSGIIRNPTTDLLTVNDEFTASIVLARSRQKEDGSFRWLIRVDAGLKPDITYYLLPSLDLTFEKLMIAEDNPVSLDAYRFETLDFFLGMTKHTRIPEAA